MSTKMKTLARWQGSTWILGTFKDLKGKEFEVTWSDGSVETLAKLKAADVLLDDNLLLEWFVSPKVDQLNAWKSSPEKFAIDALEIIGRPISPNEFKRELTRLKVPKESLITEWNGIKKFFEQNDHVLITGKPAIWSWTVEPIVKEELVSNIDLLKEFYSEGKVAGDAARKNVLKERLSHFTALELLLAWGIDQTDFPGLPPEDCEIPSWSKARLSRKILVSKNLDDQLKLSAVKQYVTVRELAKWLEDPDSEPQSISFAQVYAGRCSGNDMKALLPLLKLKTENRVLTRTLIESLVERGADFLKEAGFSAFFQGVSQADVTDFGLGDKSLSKILRIFQKETEADVRRLTFRIAIQSTTLTDESKRTLLSSASFADWQTFYSDKETRQVLNEPKFHAGIVLPAILMLLGKTQARDQLTAALALPSTISLDLVDDFKKVVKRISATDRHFAEIFLDERLHDELEETSNSNKELRSTLATTIAEIDSLKEKNATLGARIDDLMRENLQFQNANVEALRGELEQASIVVARKWATLVTQTLRDISRLPEKENRQLSESVIEGCKVAGLTVIGLPGQKVEIDPAIHDLLGISANGWGIVSDPGYKWLQNNNEILLARALVVPAE
jgi:hypothetical protein